MGAIGLLPVVALLAGSGFLPGSGGVESAVPPVRAVLRAHSVAEVSPQVPAILLVRRGSRIGTVAGAERCAEPGHGGEHGQVRSPGSRVTPPGRKGRPSPSRRDDPSAERPPPPRPIS